jgi:hypothetical protein
MNEDVRAVITPDETVAFAVVEPLDCALHVIPRRGYLNVVPNKSAEVMWPQG